MAWLVGRCLPGLEETLGLMPSTTHINWARWLMLVYLTQEVEDPEFAVATEGV